MFHRVHRAVSGAGSRKIPGVHTKQICRLDSGSATASELAGLHQFILAKVPMIKKYAHGRE